MGVFETTIVDLDARVKQSKSASLEAAKKEEEYHAAEIRVRKYEEEMRFEKEKLEQRLKHEKQIEDSRKDQNKNDKSVSAKLPKLVITKPGLKARTPIGFDFGTSLKQKLIRLMYRQSRSCHI